jgi:hypothetical protein
VAKTPVLVHDDEALFAAIVALVVQVAGPGESED